MSLWPHGLYCPWNSPDQNTGVGSLSLLQGMFPTQVSSPDPLHCRQILYQLRHQGRPRILELVAYPFSSRASWPRNQTRVSLTAGRIFTNRALSEVSTSYFCTISTWEPMVFYWKNKGRDVKLQVILYFLRIRKKIINHKLSNIIRIDIILCM